MNVWKTDTRSQQIYLITLCGACKNLLLALIKMICGWFGHSHALFADGVHSLSDLLIDSLVFVGAKFGNKAADYDHPYGHGRIETAVILFFAFLLGFVGAGILCNAIYAIINPYTPVPNKYLIWIALASISLNEILYYITRHTAQRYNSKLLMTNAWHHRSDSASSFVVLLGLIGSLFGIHWLDPIATFLVGLLILKIAGTFGWNSIRELVDTALDPDTTEQIQQSILQIPGVRAIHQLRTRSIGNYVCCDVHVLVDPKITVSEGHFISQKVEQQLMQAFPLITDVTVHIDPEEDEALDFPSTLPTRSELKILLEQYWGQLIPAESIQAARLHYLDQCLLIELLLPLSYAKNKHLMAQLQQIKIQRTFITDIKLYYKCDPA